MLGKYHESCAGGGNMRIKGFFKKRKMNFFWANHGFVPWDLPWSCGHNLLFPYFIITNVTFCCCCNLPPSFWGKLSSTASICRAQSVRAMNTDYSKCCNLISFTFLDFLESHLPAEAASGFVSKVAATVQGMPNSELHESCLKALSLRGLDFISRKKIFITRDRIQTGM